MIPVVTWGGYLTMGYFPNSTTSTKSSSFKFVCRFWAWLLVVVPPTHWRSSKVSEMNCDKPARWSGAPTTLQSKEKQRKVELEAICTLLPQETPPNDDDWAPRRNSRHFGRFLRQFGLHWFWHYPPPACAPVGPNNWKRVIWLHTFSFSRSKLDSLFLGVLIYFGAGLSHLPLRVERHLIKNFHFPPKMETSPSSPRINQTLGEEKWKCGNRKSQLRKTKYKKKERELEIRKKKIPALENPIQKERKY